MRKVMNLEQLQQMFANTTDEGLALMYDATYCGIIETVLHSFIYDYTTEDFKAEFIKAIEDQIPTETLSYFQDVALPVYAEMYSAGKVDLVACIENDLRRDHYTGLTVELMYDNVMFDISNNQMVINFMHNIRNQ